MDLLALRNALSILLFFFTGTVFAKVKHPATGEVPYSTKSHGLEFIENKGQWLPEARFMANVPDGVMFITDNGFVYNYSSQPDLERIHEMTDKGTEISGEMVHAHAYRVNFVGCNSNVSYKSENKSVAFHHRG
jgi:hypothetical protein